MNSNNPPPLPPDLPRRPKRGKKVLIGLLIAAGSIISLVLVFAGLVALFLFTSKDVPISASQKACLITAESIAQYAEIDQDPVFETLEGKRYFDKSADFIYTYWNDGDAVYLDTTVTIEQTLSDARMSYALEWGASNFGNKVGGFELVKEDRFTWGDASGYVVQKYEGEEAGFSFITRKGNRIYYVDVSGVYFESQADINKMLSSHLERFDQETFE